MEILTSTLLFACLLLVGTILVWMMGKTLDWMVSYEDYSFLQAAGWVFMAVLIVATSITGTIAVLLPIAIISQLAGH